MMDEDQTSRYVKLNKAQVSADDDDDNNEDIKPGELNQAIPTSQLHTERCNECGQVLPESYEPPANEPWSSGIFGCAEDSQSCWTGLFCPCVLFGRNIEGLRDETPWTTPCICHAVCVEGGMVLAGATAFTYGIDPNTTCLIWEGLLFSWWMCAIYTGLARQTLQRQYHLKDSPCDPCYVHCCLHWCALCQEHREMKSRLPEDSDMSMTIVNPPPVQEMTTRENQESAATSDKDDKDDASSEIPL